MAQIALFHSVLGLRPGIHDAADRFRAAGHDVLVVDQYEGRVFDDYDKAGDLVKQLGHPELLGRAAAAVAHLDDGFVAAGFSNGGGVAEFIATQRAVSGVLMLSGALPLELLGVDAWPAGVPAQLHAAQADPFRNPGWEEAVAAAVRRAPAEVEVFTDYPGRGHLFTDASLPEEHDATATELLWERVLRFCTRCDDRRRFVAA